MEIDYKSTVGGYFVFKVLFLVQGGTLYGLTSPSRDNVHYCRGCDCVDTKTTYVGTYVIWELIISTIVQYDTRDIVLVQYWGTQYKYNTVGVNAINGIGG